MYCDDSDDSDREWWWRPCRHHHHPCVHDAVAHGDHDEDNTEHSFIPDIYI